MKFILYISCVPHSLSEILWLRMDTVFKGIANFRSISLTDAYSILVYFTKSKNRVDMLVNLQK